MLWTNKDLTYGIAPEVSQKIHPGFARLLNLVQHPLTLRRLLEAMPFPDSLLVRRHWALQRPHKYLQPFGNLDVFILCSFHTSRMQNEEREGWLSKDRMCRG